MGSLMVKWVFILLINSFIIMELLVVIEGYGDNSIIHHHDHHHTVYHGGGSDPIMRKMQALKASLLQRPPSLLVSPAPAYTPPPGTTKNARVYHVSNYGADPTGKTDSTEALLKVFSEVANGASNGVLMAGIINLGGVEINLDGGDYLISRPLQFPKTGLGNILIHGGTLHASDNFPTDRFLIELSSSPSAKSEETTASFGQKLSSEPSSYNFEFITFKDLMLDCNYRGGGIAVINSLRVGIDNCYIAHFGTEAIHVQGGHETLIRSSFIGQHITAGDDPGERNFTGTGITLQGNDNVVSDVVIFSAATGVMVSGQANLISGVHCYNKATSFGGTGIYLKLPGLTQTRIVNSYLDYTGIVAEDPVQLIVSNNFFLGDAFITFKSVKGVANGVNVVDNMFSGSGTGVDIVQLDGQFGNVDQVLIDRNNVDGMNIKATVARVAEQGNGSSWTVDFNRILLFPNLIKHVQYTLSTSGDLFPVHALRNVSDNRVTIVSNLASPTSVYVMVDQGFGS